MVDRKTCLSPLQIFTRGTGRNITMGGQALGPFSGPIGCPPEGQQLGLHHLAIFAACHEGTTGP